MTNIKQATDAELFEELNKCKVAHVLLSKTAYKKQWSCYEVAIKSELANRSAEFVNMSDDELLTELFA